MSLLDDPLGDLLEPEWLEHATPEEAELYMALARQAMLEGDYNLWLRAIFPGWVTAPFAPHHRQVWEWGWAIEAGERSTPLTAILPRGHGKSTMAELLIASLGARRKRHYVLYVCASQEQADDHVGNVAKLLEEETFARVYPEMADRAVGKFGNVKGWRRNRLVTASGFVVDAVGLDTATRGVKFEEQRPDLIVVDDIDREKDKPAEVDRKIRVLTRELLPAGAPGLTVLFVQNLVHQDSVFARLANGTAGFLLDGEVIGPIPAIENFTWEQLPDGGIGITGGEPTWEGMGLAKCQEEIDTYGVTAFLIECQHKEVELSGGLFDHLDFSMMHVTREQVPDLGEITCWVDPAISSTDGSDSMGIQIDGIHRRSRTIYRLWSWEMVTSPNSAIRTALEASWRIGAEYGCWVETLGVETDQGGDTWEEVYKKVLRELSDEGLIPEGARIPKYAHKKAASIGAGKVERAGQMLVDYEIGRFRHVLGTHTTLERSLNRFPRFKPYDLVDAAYWSWRHLAKPARRKATFSTPKGTMPQIQSGYRS